MLTTYTVPELLVARQPLRWRHPSGRPVNGSLGARGCPERRALALGLLILRAQRRETCPVCHVGIASCRCAADLDVSPAEWFQGQDLALAAYRAEHRERTA